MRLSKTSKVPLQRKWQWLLNHVNVMWKGRKSSLLLASDTKQTPFIYAKLFQTARSQGYLFHSFVRLSKTSQIPQREWHSCRGCTLAATPIKNTEGHGSFLIHSKLTDDAAPCFLPLFLEAKKTVTKTLRGVRCTIGAGRLPRWTTTALRSYTWWLSPKCIEGKRSENVRLRETTASRIHLRVTRNAWSARHVSMKERNSYNLDSLQILERFLQKKSKTEVETPA